MIMRKARAEEIDICFGFTESAKAYQQSLGFTQWSAIYPTRQMIEQDVADGVGYVFTEGDTLLGYCCMIVGDEPAYHAIDGAWKTNRPYAVIHRLAFGDGYRGKGLSKAAFSLIKDACIQAGVYAIRIDTKSENIVMRHIFEREGFVFCGIVDFGGPKLAYEWDG